MSLQSRLDLLFSFALKISSKLTVMFFSAHDHLMMMPLVTAPSSSIACFVRAKRTTRLSMLSFPVTFPLSCAYAAHLDRQDPQVSIAEKRSLESLKVKISPRTKTVLEMKSHGSLVRLCAAKDGEPSVQQFFVLQKL